MFRRAGRRHNRWWRLAVCSRSFCRCGRRGLRKVGAADGLHFTVAVGESGSVGEKELAARYIDHVRALVALEMVNQDTPRHHGLWGPRGQCLMRNLHIMKIMSVRNAVASRAKVICPSTRQKDCQRVSGAGTSMVRCSVRSVVMILSRSRSSRERLSSWQSTEKSREPGDSVVFAVAAMRVPLRVSSRRRMTWLVLSQSNKARTVAESGAIVMTVSRSTIRTSRTVPVCNGCGVRQATNRSKRRHCVRMWLRVDGFTLVALR